MASSWPAAFDASFPGWPYSDNVEFVMAAHANSWVSAIQALETGIGSGSGSSVQNPLFSPTFNETFATLTARIAALEAYVETNAIQLDEAASDIKPVAATASAGNSGSAADAKHVHVGVTSFNARSGAIVPTVADISEPFTAAGQIYAGTGNATGKLLPKGAAGSILQVGGADPSGLQWNVGGLRTPGQLVFTSAVNWSADLLLADGLPVSRTTYVNLLGATTWSQSATFVLNNRTINGMNASITQFLGLGMPVESPNLPSNCFITSIGTTSIQVSQGASAGGSANVQIFPHGNGNGSTTFNTADMRGRSPLGVDWFRSGPNNNFQPWGFLGYFGGECNHALELAEGCVHTHGGETAAELQEHTHAGSTSDEGEFHGHFPPSGFSAFACASGAGGRFKIPNSGLISGGGLVCDVGSHPGFGGDIDCGDPDQSHTHSYDTGNQNDNHGHPFDTDDGGCLGNAHNNLHPFYGGVWLVQS